MQVKQDQTQVLTAVHWAETQVTRVAQCLEHFDSTAVALDFVHVIEVISGVTKQLDRYPYEVKFL